MVGTFNLPVSLCFTWDGFSGGSFGCGSSQEELIRQASQSLDWVWRALWSDDGLSL